MKSKYLVDIEDEILKVIKKSKKSLTKDEIVEKTRLRLSKKYMEEVTFSKESLSIIDNVINDYIACYDLIEIGNGYKYINNTSFHKGTFSILKNGNGVVVEDTSYIKDNEIISQKEEYHVKKENVKGAHDGDFVLVEVIENGRRPLIKIDRILDNKLDVVYGEIYRHKDYGYYVKPVNKVYKDIFIPIDNDMMLEQKLVEGNRVRVKLSHTDTDASDFYRVVSLDKLSHRDEPGVDVFWEALRHGMDNDFSDESWKQVDWIPAEVLPSDRIGRSDFTDMETFTIDGKDTKDMDDAISCSRLNNGNFMLRVHIADVAHYVSKNSPLDKDAYRKSTSTYAGNKVIPMLPHELSNNICSLNPNVDRLTVTCSMEIDNEGNVCNYSIVNSVINSDLKMSYDKVNKILKNKTICSNNRMNNDKFNELLKNNEIDSEYRPFTRTLLLMNQLALVLRKKRLRDGSIEFAVGDKEEIFDDDGMMIGARMRENDYAENLIEEFMIVANETVDKHLSRYGYPCLHRVHGRPNEDKVADLIRLLNILGYRFNMLDANDCVSNPKYMKQLAEFTASCGDLGDVLSSRLIRSMAKAKYSPNNIGHYGLGKNNYCHFTSPIRRYPDLVIHRILKETSLGDYHGKKISLADLLLIGDYTSKKERAAADVERAVFDMNCASFLQDYVGERFTGTIIELGEKGLRIRLDNFMEGIVRFKEQETYYDPYIYSFSTEDEVYHFGDRLELEVLKNDDVLPLHHNEDEQTDYEQYVRENLDKIDNRNTYLKITGRIIEDNKVLKK